MLAKNLSELGAARLSEKRMPRASARFSLLGTGLNLGNARLSNAMGAALAVANGDLKNKSGLPSGRDSARSQADELHIENERLKTTLTILTQKLKVIEDDNNHAKENLQS